MNNYKWQGIDSQGRECRGSLSAASHAEAHSVLVQRRIMPFRLNEKKSFFRLPPILLFSKKSLSLDHLIFIFCSLSLLLKSGIPLREALRCAGLQAEHIPAIKSFCTNAEQALEKGVLFSSFLESEAISYPFIAPLIAASEYNGTFSHTCNMIALYLEERLTIRKKLRSAATLPCITLLSAFAMLIGMSIFIIPRFQLLYASFDKELPALTQTLFWSVGFLGSQWFFFFIGLLCVLGLVVKKTNFKRYVPNFFSFLPLFKTIRRYQDQLYFFQTVSLLISSGISLLPALTLVKKIVSPPFSAVLEAIQIQLHEGASLQHSVQQFPRFFSSDHCALIALGERSGTLVTILETLAQQTSNRYSSYINVLITLFQPCLLLVIGSLIAGILMALYAPLLNLASLV